MKRHPRLYVHTSPAGDVLVGGAGLSAWPRERLRCGAHARSTGKPCVAPAMANGRCRRHGGLSTGPKSLEAREAARQRMRAINERRRAYQKSCQHPMVEAAR